MASQCCGTCGRELSPSDRFCAGCGCPVFKRVPALTRKAEIVVPTSPGGETADSLLGTGLSVRDTDARNALVAKALNYGIFDWDLRSDNIYWDDRSLRLLGLSYQDCGMAYEDFLSRVHPEDRQGVRESFFNHLEREAEFDEEYRIRHADGGYRNVVSRAETERDAEGRALRMAGIIDDVTERRALEGQLANMAFHDPLTSLPNRALFMDRLEHALDRGDRQEAKLAVLYLDLDDFKGVNDSLGHESGDRALVAVAERLRACVRPSDTVARFGGDEFTVLLEGAGEAQARCVVARILEKLDTPIAIDGWRFRLTPSIGVAFGGPGSRSADLLRDSDQAMYEAKRAGKTRYATFRAGIDGEISERSDFEKDLLRAVEEGEFVVHYQPKVLLDGLGVFALEALVRWKHPNRGLIPPAEFIPVAEETDLIVPIGEWVLGQACTQVKAWQERYPSRPPLMVSVNLSPRQFRQPDLAERVAKALLGTGLDPGCLILEVAESALLEYSDAADAALPRLRNLGVSIALDDFGTAHSSPASLERWPVDALNVDRSFVAGLGENGDDALVSSILDMASGLGLSVVAEGVETSWQLARLRNMGCSRAQGYYFARPLPSAEAISLFQRRPFE